MRKRYGRMANPLNVAISLDVEEEGLFGRHYVMRNPPVTNIRHLTKLLPFLERGARPTLFCTYSVLADKKARKTLDELRSSWPMQLGTHLHFWNTPPLRDAAPGKPLAKHLPITIFNDKMRELMAIATDYYGYAPTAFRMGRWDLHNGHWPILAANGIKEDASVRPFHCGADKKYGPDHFHAPVNPYKIQTSFGQIFEMPLTVTPVSPALARFLGSRSSRSLRDGFQKWGALTLLPVEHPLWLLKLTTLLHVKRGGSTISLTWHSSEMMPGGNPHLPNDKAVSYFLAKIGHYLDWLENRYDIRYVTLSDLSSSYPAKSISADFGDWQSAS